MSKTNKHKMSTCLHEYEKLSDEPVNVYWNSNGRDYGYKVLEYRCRCKKCGKEKNVKHFANVWRR